METTRKASEQHFNYRLVHLFRALLILSRLVSRPIGHLAVCLLHRVDSHDRANESSRPENLQRKLAPSRRSPNWKSLDGIFLITSDGTQVTAEPWCLHSRLIRALYYRVGQFECVLCTRKLNYYLSPHAQMKSWSWPREKQTNCSRLTANLCHMQSN